MRISDWSSDVCSSDLLVAVRLVLVDPPVAHGGMMPGLSLFAQGRERAGSRKNSNNAEWLSAAIPITQHNEVKDDQLPSRQNPRCHLLVHRQPRSEEHTSELQSLMRITYAVFCLKKKTQKLTNT